MSAKRISLIITLLIALLITGCGTDSKDQLKQPSVYKNPQVRITHAPTEIVAEPAIAEATSEIATQEVVNNPEATEIEPEDQAYLDEVENLLNKVEDELDRMDTNP